MFRYFKKRKTYSIYSTQYTQLYAHAEERKGVKVSHFAFLLHEVDSRKNMFSKSLARTLRASQAFALFVLFHPNGKHVPPAP